MFSVLKNGKLKLAFLIVFSILSLGLLVGVVNSSITIDDNVFQGYDTTLGQNGDPAGTPIQITFDRYTFIGGAYTFDNSSATSLVDITETGMYKIGYSCTWDSSGANGRHVMNNWVRNNDNGKTLYPSQTQCYIRNSGDGETCSNNAVFMQNLSAGDTIELMGDKDSGTSGATNTIADCSLYVQQIEDKAVAQIHDNIGGQDFGSAAQTINLDYVSYLNSSYYLLNNDELNFTTAGMYKVYYTLCAEQTTGASNANVRQTIRGLLRVNGSTTHAPSEVLTYTRSGAASNGNYNCAVGSTLINATVNTSIQLRGDIKASDSTETVETTLNQSWIFVERMTGVGHYGMVLESVGGQTIANGANTAVTFDTTVREDSVISHDSSTNTTAIAITERGLYEVSYNIPYLDDNAGRVETCGYLRLNGATTVVPSRNCDYTRGRSGIRESTVSNTVLMNLSENNFIELMVNPVGGSVDINPNGAWVIVRKLERNGSIDLTINQPFTNAFVKQNETITFNTSITCNANSEQSCGNLSTSLQFANNTNTTIGNISRINGTTPLWTFEAQPQYCVLGGGESCSVQWIVNGTGAVNTSYNISTLVDSNISTITNYRTENVTLSIVAGDVIILNTSTYNFGTFSNGTGDRTVDIGVITSVGNHTNINLSCVGNCTQITSNWFNGYNQNEGITNATTFTCSELEAGSFMANYSLTSTEDTTPFELSLTCTVVPPPGTLTVDILAPDRTQITNVSYDANLTVTANVSCDGNCQNVSTFIGINRPFGDGSDGTVTITSANTIINNYTYLVATENSENAKIQVNDSSEFSVGDEILIIQMQNGSGTGTAGNYEFREIRGKAGNTLTLDTYPDHIYGSGLFNRTSASVTQIIRVPEYINLTINGGASVIAPAWNGYQGGIVVFRANDTITMTGDVNVSFAGYRGGGCGLCDNNDYGDAGESYTGLGTGTVSRNQIGGGGGYGPSGFGGDPGGGGGHATAGGIGDSDTPANDAEGGNTVGNVNLTRIYFGGGGGGGGDNDNRLPLSRFTDGGGAALIFGEVIASSNVYAQGEDGISEGSSGAGSSGAGAGGTIWLVAENLTINNVNASGGQGTTNAAADFSGDGGDGRVRLDYTNLVSGSPVPAAGFSGTLSNVPYNLQTVGTALPFWALAGVQPQNCSLALSGNCIFNWVVNASGRVGDLFNLSVFARSDFFGVDSMRSLDIPVRIVNVQPNITAVSPLNQSSLFYTGEVNLTWFINDTDDNSLTCLIFLNGTNVANQSCTNGTGFYLTNISVGNHNWSVTVNDSLNATDSTPLTFFTMVQNSTFTVTKTIRNVGANLYVSEIELINGQNLTVPALVLDRVEPDMIAGSFTPSFDLNTSLYGPTYDGILYGWNLSISPSSTTVYNYSLTNVTQDYEIGRNYVVGLG